MNVCFFGTYERGHSANRLLARAVVDAGDQLEELHEPGPVYLPGAAGPPA